MKECPNCKKKLKDNFEYCRICGTKLTGENPGDFTTEILNVFNHENRFIYLFCENGNQTVLEADTMDELALVVRDKSYPWEFRDKSKNPKSAKDVEMVKAPPLENDFIMASSFQKPEVIATSSTARKSETKSDESYVPDFEVSRVVDDKDNTIG